ncbi:hypothetical protein Ccrd_014843 [Cynara cardunculus var. scolymus]|uniref:Uncharacterized protein n=1 Tax=Cynara cardunculus var. scolymus TaxID=59895 RepID=A0A103YCY9_CYNCS|nr:hypothetical protein Ccrd_014843 [Cynara cardunculus var. scolymus]
MIQKVDARRSPDLFALPQNSINCVDWRIEFGCFSNFPLHQLRKEPIPFPTVGEISAPGLQVWGREEGCCSDVYGEGAKEVKGTHGGICWINSRSNKRDRVALSFFSSPAC